MKTPAPEVEIRPADPERSDRLEVVAEIEPELRSDELPPQPGPAASEPPESIASWAEVVRLLALGRTPELRACPVCGNVSTRAAKLCASCWAKLPPLISE